MPVYHFPNIIWVQALQIDLLRLADDQTFNLQLISFQPLTELAIFNTYIVRSVGF